MALTTELLLTLKQIKGLGNKTTLNVAHTLEADSIKSLCSQWNFKGNKRLDNITEDDLLKANSVAKKIMQVSKEEGIGIISYFENYFPAILKQCVNEKGILSPPIVLFYRGNLDALKRPGVAVIGTREPTPNGVKAGIYFSGELAKRGFNIVSGLATGSDTSVHEGALLANGVTTAFLATSLDWWSIYPKQNQNLAKRIVENKGLLLSEYYIGQKLSRYAFVERDRLQAGLSYGTIIIQTDITGGTLHAVNATLKSGKPLMTVKYNSEEDFNHKKTAGNREFISKRMAHPLSTQNIELCVDLINTCIRNNRDEKRSHTLFD